MRQIAPEAQKLLLAYIWPGNVRELKNVIERAMILSNSDELLPMHFPREIVGYVNGDNDNRIDPWEQWLDKRPMLPVSLEEVNARVEQYFIRWALETAKHNRTRAAQLLGMAKVDQLRYLMRKHDIE